MKQAKQPVSHYMECHQGKVEKVVHLSCSRWGRSWQALRAALLWLQRSHLPHQVPANHKEDDKATMKKKREKNQ